MESNNETQQAWFLMSSYPVLFPFHKALTKPQAEFDDFIRNELKRRHEETAAREDETPSADKAMSDVAESETFTLVTDTTSAEITKGVNNMEVEAVDTEMSVDPPVDYTASHPFMHGLKTHGMAKPEAQPTRTMENMMHTENSDLAYRSTTNPLVDLFSELEDVISGPRLAELLQSAWNEDALASLKVIFNARSIHLGKSSRTTFYRASGWLAQNHPLTLAANLRWLSRPVIEKKVEKKQAEDDIVIVEEKDENDPSKFDVRHGVAHGYWKDLLNLLALAANKKLDVLSDPRDVLNSENPGILRGKSHGRSRGRGLRVRGVARGRGLARGRGRGRGGSRGGSISAPWAQTPEDSGVTKSKTEKKRVDPKELRHETREKRHDTAVNEFNTNPVYRVLHLTVARLFAEQLEKDLSALRGSDPKAKRTISLCGKWAPTHDHFHDRHTFIVSTIAEILHPRDSMDNLSPTDSRETYLRYAREKYRKDTSALRKHLEIVERDITEQKFENIKYDRLPSIAMKNYSKLFIEKDLDGFEKYLDRVAEGKSKISGATLLPSTLIHAAREFGSSYEDLTPEQKAQMSATDLVNRKVASMEVKVLNGQWNTLVQRIKDSGTLDNCIAVCDVSGSMGSPVFPDKSTPMDSAIGLSLLVAGAAKPPFGGTFITFSARPEVVKIDLTKSLVQQYQDMSKAAWDMNTDFVAVFEKLILPMAIENNLKPEDMVKRVFVFSDMQFDQAGSSNAWYQRGIEADNPSRWSTSFERIKTKFEEAGYELPELVFWNLAGGRGGYTGWGDPTAPKPVTAQEEGTCLVSGYSQGMLKVFLDNGAFEDPEEEEEEDSETEVVVTKDEEGNVTEEQPKKKKAKMDPMAIVKKSIGHKAYDMLKVVD